MSNLFVKGTYTSKNGRELFDKIECDALSDEDWDALAAWFVDKVGPIGEVISVPTGGDKLAKALREYSVENGRKVICDDVATTGQSLDELHKEHPTAIGLAVFARTMLVPEWVVARFIERV